MNYMLLSISYMAISGNDRSTRNLNSLLSNFLGNKFIAANNKNEVNFAI